MRVDSQTGDRECGEDRTKLTRSPRGPRLVAHSEGALSPYVLALSRPQLCTPIPDVPLPLPSPSPRRPRRLRTHAMRAMQPPTHTLSTDPLHILLCATIRAPFPFLHPLTLPAPCAPAPRHTALAALMHDHARSKCIRRDAGIRRTPQEGSKDQRSDPQECGVLRHYAFCQVIPRRRALMCRAQSRFTCRSQTCRHADIPLSCPQFAARSFTALSAPLSPCQST